MGIAQLVIWSTCHLWRIDWCRKQHAWWVDGFPWITLCCVACLLRQLNV